MGTIVTSGVGSGLDISGLVTKLVEAEGAPKKLQLDKQEAKAQAKLSALGSLRSALSTLRDSLAGLKSVDKFQGRQATLSSLEFLSASAATTAVAGSYSVEVQRLASAHKLQSGPFASTSTPVGTGTLNIATGGHTFAVEIDGENQSLADIAAAINASPAGAKVIATVISGASDARLTLTARESGEAHALSVSQTGGDGGLAALVYPPSGGGLSELQAALDSRALVDGVLVTSSTNTISDAIAGVELTLKTVNDVGQTTTLSVNQDRTAARKAVDDFVKGYNGFVDASKTLTGYNVDTRQGGPLFGDSGVRNIMDQLRRELTTNVAGAAIFKSLSSIGVTAQLDGKLTVDAAELDAAFDTNFDAVGELFASKDGGLAVKLDALLERHLASQGAIESRTEGLKSTIDAIGERREALADRLTALQARYTRQFNALDGLLSQLQGTSNFLNQQLSNLPGSAPLNRSR
jgi:flagellar hook-associated protein 2